MNRINGQRELTITPRVGVPVAASLAIALALGCDSQADPAYQGEPLATVDGRVESALSVGDVEVGVLWLTAESSEQCSDSFELICTGEVTVLAEPSACADACGEADCESLEEWEACVEACPDVTNVIAEAKTPLCITGGVGQTTPAVGAFPAQFSLDILEPPPAEALIGSATGERLAYGVFVAVDPAGAPWRLDLTQLPDFPDWLLGGSDSHFLLYTPDSITASSTYGAAFQSELAPGFHLMQTFLEIDGDEEVAGARPAPPGDAAEVLLVIGPPESIALPLPF
jgi:hypothetical protein